MKSLFSGFHACISLLLLLYAVSQALAIFYLHCGYLKDFVVILDKEKWESLCLPLMNLNIISTFKIM